FLVPRNDVKSLSGGRVRLRYAISLPGGGGVRRLAGEPLGQMNLRLDYSNLDHYSARTAPGPTYHADDGSVVVEVPAGTTSYSTIEGLVAPGATAQFRVFVVLTTANENGSNAVSVTRPG